MDDAVSAGAYHALVLGAFSPQEEKDFLYAPSGEFHGEAAHLLDALGISTMGKGADAVHAEFQRAGFFLTHVLECPLDRDAGPGDEAAALLAQRLQAVARRIRRSLKPKRVVLISRALGPILEKNPGVGTGLSGCVGQWQTLRIRWSCTGEFGLQG